MGIYHASEVSNMSRSLLMKMQIMTSYMYGDISRERGLKHVEESLDVLDLLRESVRWRHVFVELLPLGHELVHSADVVINLFAGTTHAIPVELHSVNAET